MPSLLKDEPSCLSFDEKTSSFRWQIDECNCYSTRMVNLVEQSEAHVIVLFLGLLLLLLLLGGLRVKKRVDGMDVINGLEVVNFRRW